MNLLDYQTPILHDVFILLRVPVSENLENVVSSEGQTKRSAAMFVCEAQTSLHISSLATKHSFAYKFHRVFRREYLEKIMSRENLKFKIL